MVLYGIDISSWQGNIAVDKMNMDFVIIKATEGTNYVNEFCDSRYQLAKSSGKKLGVYHYAKNGNARSEAEYFYNNVKNYVGEAILFLDYEEGISTNSPNWCRQFLDRLQELTGIKGMLYTYDFVIRAQNWQTVVDGDYGLWYAKYGANNPLQGFQNKSIPSVPFWGTPAIFQYSSNTFLSGYAKRLDANNFYGDRAAWDAYVTGGKVKPTPTPDVEKENDDMTEFLAVHDNTIYYVVQGVSVTGLHNTAELSLVKEMYEMTHDGKKIKEINLENDTPKFERLLLINKDEKYTSEYAVIHGNAIHLVVHGVSVTTLATMDEWKLVNNLYQRFHNATAMTLFDWSNDTPKFERLVRICNSKTDNFIDTVTKGLEEIKDSLPIVEE